MRVANEYRCLRCTMELDPTEYSTPEDADICGYCFADKINEIKGRNIPWPKTLCEAGIHRNVCFIADAEIRLEQAEKDGNGVAIAIYTRLLRLLQY